ncbi:placenta-expressed transcript 1 protein [Lepus europaeus]|uniref:placenta-expressed transcript 1 protein n=1 Tax=Lepus europaeus TaxID=9983 RepID=UPI002B46FE67|nr:placenta-expressed transcript 1 protein [Lepus europaeus]
MAALCFPLLPLGLLLHLGLHLTSASSANYSDNCTAFDEVSIMTSSPGIRAYPDVYESNTLYTVWIPVNENVSSVVLRALDSNYNSVGSWQSPDERCNDSVLYYVTPGDNTPFSAQWRAPAADNVTEVELQAFSVDFNNTALFSSLKLDKVMTTTLTSKSSTPVTSKSSTILTSRSSTTLPPRISTALTSRTPKNPSTTTATTTTPTTSLAHRAFSSPITGALHILLIFLTGKLLF